MGLNLELGGIRDPAVRRALERIAKQFPLAASPASVQRVPQVRVFNSAALSIPNATATAITFDSERWDLGAPAGAEHHSTGTNTSRLTCRVAGLYVISGHMLWAGAAGGVHRIAFVRLNGTTEIGDQNSPPAATSNSHVSVTAQWRLAVGDYVELMAYQDSGGALNVIYGAGGSPEFSMHWASP